MEKQHPTNPAYHLCNEKQRGLYSAKEALCVKAYEEHVHGDTRQRSNGVMGCVDYPALNFHITTAQ